MFITFKALYDEYPVKIDPKSVVGFVTHSYKPFLRSNFFRSIYGPKVVGTNILLKGGHQVYVTSDIEMVEKLLKGKKK